MKISLPHFSALALCVVMTGASAVAQTPVSFSSVTSTAGETPANIYSVDVNNDGLSDIVQDTAQSPSAFTVSINNGEGTFKAPVTYTLPGNKTIAMPIATADFNNDGYVDIAVTLVGTNQIAVYLGNGDGTFQAPKISTIALPAGVNWNMAGSAAADFNADGNIDLVANAGESSNSDTYNTEFYVVEGDGKGDFSTPHAVLAAPPLQPGFQALVGDFDSDGKADIAALVSTENSEGGTANSTVYVLYGNNDFTFTSTTPFTTNGGFNLGAGDLNSDGLTDLFGETSGNSSQLYTFYGKTSRTFDTYSMNVSNANLGAQSDSWQWVPQLTMADFNGDTYMDLAATAWNAAYNQTYVEYFLAGSNPGEFTPQLVTLPESYIWDTVPVAGLYNGNMLTPDVVLNESPNGGSPPQNTPSYLITERNNASSGYFGPCAYLRSGEGFNVCSAGTPLGTGTLFSASVNSYGQLRKIELWVDGKKIEEQHHTWGQHAYFDQSETFAAGTHQATMYAADVDNRLQRTDFSFTVGGGSSCPAPSSPSVYVCSPAQNSTTTSPVQATASATITGSLGRMELWVDGAKVYTETTSLTLNTSVALSSGQHKLDFYAVNTSGMSWETTAYTTVH